MAQENPIEIISKNDYKKTEVLGLLPTDRDPSAWLRMVARIFAAYREIDVTKTVSSYIDGFHILNDVNDIETHDSDNYTFLIEKGTCFIDDQFIGFKNNVLVKFPKKGFIQNNDYYLVLQYNWLMQADYNLAYFETIPSDLFVEGEMLKIRGFKINSSGDIELAPDDLDDQYASNFKKLMNLTSEKISDSLESIKYQYLVYDPTDNKFDVSCKSGDFVYLDYITGKYFPAKSCIKRLDKAVGLYLKDKTNNKDYIINNGYIDFSNPRWKIDPARIYLKTLEPGSSYYLADNCTIGDPVNPNITVNSIDPGKISTKFYPGIVRVGYAVESDKLYIQLDYSSEIDTQNILELFGNKESFDIRYQDYYKYYSLISQQQFLINKISQNNDKSSSLQNKDDALGTSVDSTQKTYTDDKTTYESKKSALDDFINKIDLTNDFSEIFKRYSYGIQFNDTLFNQKYFDNISDSIKHYYNIINSIDISGVVTNNKKSNYNDTDSSNSYNNFLKVNINNITALNTNLKNNLNIFYNLINSASEITSNDYNLSNVKSLSVVTSNYFNKSLTSTNYLLYLDSFYKIDSGTETGYLNTIQTKLSDILTDLKNKFKTTNRYIFDYSNVFRYSYSVTWNKYEHILYKVDNVLSEDLIFNEEKNKNDTSTSLESGTDYDENSDTNSISISYSSSSNILQYFKLEGYSELRNIFEKMIQVISFEYSYIYFLKQLIIDLKNKVNNYKSNSEAIIDSISSFNTDIKNHIDNFNTKNKELLVSHQNVLIDKVNLFTLKKQKSVFDTLLSNSDDANIDYSNKLTDVNDQITNLKSSLGDDLDFNTPTKSIFMISNYQRMVYNYTYITNRLKLKYSERKIIEDRIQIATNAHTVVLSKVPVDKAMDERLKNIIASYNALLDEINLEISSMTDEYNKIRTEHFGLGPIAHDDPNFSDDGYAIFDLDCLDSVE